MKRFNQVDGKIDRRSFTGYYLVDSKTKRPRNPVGRTGSEFRTSGARCVEDDVSVTGRGRLYHWGPNHAGDPVVTRYVSLSTMRCRKGNEICRWKRDSKGSIVYRRRDGEDYSKPVLEFVAIERRDTKQWALPGVSEIS